MECERLLGTSERSVVQLLHIQCNTISYVNTPIDTLLEKHRNDKKQQYNELVEDRREGL